MRVDEDRLIYIGFGPLAAILLGVALLPFREAVIASTLAVPFIILTIAIAYFGGHPAAVATALVCALSIDFFLTKPYRRLAIGGKHDVTVFLGLAACGVVAAALGSRRNRRKV